MGRPGGPDRTFWRAVWAGAAPLLVWALHFALCYVSVSLVCTPAAYPVPFNESGVRALLGGSTVAALLIEWLLWRAASASWRDNQGLQAAVSGTTALLSAVAIAWTGGMLFMTRLCEQG